MKILNLEGFQVGQLTVIEDSGKRANDGCKMWRCKCECGNENYLISTTDLRRQGARAPKHCNNSIHSIVDITGQTFGSLEVIELDKISLGTRKIKWLCKCHKCNREDLVSILGSDLKCGKTQTCGCGHSTSKGAEKIQNILNNSKLFKVIQEFSFDNLINPKTNRKLKFDFAVYSDTDKLSYLIEYDGEQHFYFTNGEKTWNTEENFLETKYRDTLKNKYCLTNNILLYRIPYYDLQNINSLNDILQDKYLIKDSM